MDDLSQRDLSRIPESRMSEEERQEFQRRKKEFIDLLRRKGGLPSAGPKPSEPRVKPWDPRTVSRSRG